MSDSLEQRQFRTVSLYQVSVSEMWEEGRLSVISYNDIIVQEIWYLVPYRRTLQAMETVFLDSLSHNES